MTAAVSFTAKEVAVWMMGQYSLHERLDQSVVAFGIQETFGDEFVYINDNGNWAIVKPVLTAFNAISGPDVVWSRSDRAWRKRLPFDMPGRQQP